MFSIGVGETTRFVQQSAASAILNRVVGQDPSAIFGTLSSNGRVFLLNPNGIVFGVGSVVNVAGLVASTLNLSDQDFLAGRLNFEAGAVANPIVNHGSITTPSGGRVYLIAPNIENHGVISTQQGQTILAAGKSVQLVEADVPNLRVEVQAGGEALNVGQILAEGGSAGIYAGLINQKGIVRADSVSRDATGKIVFRSSGATILDTGSLTSASGAQGGTVTLDSGWAGVGGDIRADGENGGGRIDISSTGGYLLAATLSATCGSGAGGAIDVNVAGKSWENVHAKVDASGAIGGSIRHVAGQQITTSGTYLAKGSSGLGGRIDLAAPATKLLSAQLHADGASGGGQVRVGGEYQGGKNLTADELPNAELLAISAGSVITADATQSGPGGTVITWANLKAAMYGDVSARPANGAAGGFIEISSGDKLTYGGTASAGLGGTVLFDPKNIVIGPATSASQYAIVLGYNYVDVARLTGNDLEAGDSFGNSVSLSGTQLAVGAPGDDGAGNGVFAVNSQGNTGVVYLFNNPFSAPSLAGIIGKGYTGTGNLDVSALGPTSDNFGYSVSLSGTQLAVGAPLEPGADNNTVNAGAVYLINNPFTAPALAGIIGKGYTGTGNLNVSALEAFDLFGSSVSLSGTQLVVGAPADDGVGNATNNAGAVYLFNNPFSTPTLAGVIGKGYTGTGNFNVTALDAGGFFAGDRFGSSVSLSGTRLAVGAFGDAGPTNATTGAGAVYLFNNPFTAPALAGVIGKGYTGTGNLDVSALEGNDLFGVSVSLAGTQLAVGATGDAGPTNSTPSAGAVYLFNNPFSAPSLAGVIGKGYTGSGNFDVNALAAGDQFGTSVSLSGTQLAVGASSDDGVNSTNGAGAVYLFNNPFTAPALAGMIGKGYTGTGNLDVNGLGTTDQFGASVSLAGTQLAVGAPGDAGALNNFFAAGAVYLINNPFSAPSLAGVIGKGYAGPGNLDVSALEGNDLFGVSVSLAGTQLAVGAFLDNGAGNAFPQAGAVYLINNPFTTPALAGVIGKGYTGPGNFDVSALEALDNFGRSVSLAGTQLAVGAPNDSGAGNGFSNAGAVYLINNPFTAPVVAGVIGKGYTGPSNFDVSALAVDDFFGTSVSLVGTQLAVGAPRDDGAANNVTNAGAVYLFNNPFTALALAGVIGKGYTGTGNFDVSALEANDLFGSSVSLSGTQLAVGALGDDGAGNATSAAGVGFGAVYGFTLGGGGDAVASATFANNPGADSTITPAAITAITNTGSSVVLQANNDITLAAASNIVTSAGGAGGAITLQAGRSVLLNSSITTDNGDLTIKANEQLASGVVDAQRDPGAAVITMASGTSLNAGSGNVTVHLRDGAGLTNSQGGAITLWNVSGANVLLQNDAGAGVGAINILGTLGTGALTATSTGAMNLGQGTVTGNLTASSNGGAISQSGALSVTGAANITAGAAPIALTAGANDFQGVVTLGNSGANAVSITDMNAISFASMTLGGAFTVTAPSIVLSNVTNTGFQQYNGNVLFNSTYTTNGGAFNVTGTTTLGGASTINAGAGAITLTGAVDSALATNNSLALFSSSVETFGSTIGATQALSSISTDAPGTVSLGGNVTTTGAQSFNDAVTAGTVTLTSTGGGAIFVNNAGSSFPSGISTTGTVTFAGPLAGTSGAPLALLVTPAGLVFTQVATAFLSAPSIPAAITAPTGSSITINGVLFAASTAPVIVAIPVPPPPVIVTIPAPPPIIVEIPVPPPPPQVLPPPQQQAGAPPSPESEFEALSGTATGTPVDDGAGARRRRAPRCG